MPTCILHTTAMYGNAWLQKHKHDILASSTSPSPCKLEASVLEPGKRNVECNVVTSHVALPRCYLEDAWGWWMYLATPIRNLKKRHCMLMQCRKLLLNRLVILSGNSHWHWWWGGAWYIPNKNKNSPYTWSLNACLKTSHPLHYLRNICRRTVLWPTASIALWKIMHQYFPNFSQLRLSKGTADIYLQRVEITWEGVYSYLSACHSYKAVFYRVNPLGYIAQICLLVYK